MWPQLLRLFGAVGVYVDVIIAGIAQHQRSGAAAAEGKEIEVVTAPAERNPAACTQHDGIFFIAGPAFLCIGDNCDHGGTSSHEIKDKRFHFLKHGLAGISAMEPPSLCPIIIEPSILHCASTSGRLVSASSWR